MAGPLGGEYPEKHDRMAGATQSTATPKIARSGAHRSRRGWPADPRGPGKTPIASGLRLGQDSPFIGGNTGREMTKAFENVRILDFSQVIAGPFATQLLNMLGAEVIKIEQPRSGDQMRSLLHLDPPAHADMSPPFVAYNFGKKSVAINLKSPDAKDVIFRLAATCDVVLENFRAGVIEQLGFGYEAIRNVKPDIVYCSISGYGQDGPDAHKGAYDAAIQAAAGMMASTGYPDSGPTRATAFPIDVSTGLTAAFAITSALYRRARTGEGQYLDVAMQDAAITLLSSHYARFLAGGPEPQLLGNLSPSGIPTSDAFETADGHLLVATATAGQSELFLKAIGLENRLNEPAFKDYGSRIRNKVEVRAAIAEIMKGRTSDEWVRLLEPLKLPVAKVRNVGEVCADPQLATRGIFAAVASPDRNGESCQVPAAAFVANRDGPGVPGPAPRLGEHTHDVLRMLGYDDAEISRLHLE
jgi:crotonobetainyl-CoA:carnitine CoA-transferase CaiB-like acyl-CoA transferase